MRITWFGHAAFGIVTHGQRIIIDPYRAPDCGGYAPINAPADLVLTSHENDKYHSHLGQIVPPFDVVRGPEIPPEGLTRHGIRFHAIPCFETPEKLHGDEVAILHFRCENLHIVHLGDLGHSLTNAELAPIKHADIVLAAAGGPPTIDFPLIAPLLEAIGPKVVIPMHYLIPGKIDLNIQPLETFLKALPNWPSESEGSSTAEFFHETLPTSRRILILNPAR